MTVSAAGTAGRVRREAQGRRARPWRQGSGGAAAEATLSPGRRPCLRSRRCRTKLVDSTRQRTERVYLTRECWTCATERCNHGVSLGSLCGRRFLPVWCVEGDVFAGLRLLLPNDGVATPWGGVAQVQRTPTDSTTCPRESEPATEARAARRTLLAAKDGPALGVLGPAAVGDVFEAVCQQVVLGLLAPASSTCECARVRVGLGVLARMCRDTWKSAPGGVRGHRDGLQ